MQHHSNIIYCTFNNNFFFGKEKELVSFTLLIKALAATYLTPVVVYNIPI